MKALKIIAKIVVALAAVAGVVYVVATYGDKIVAWCKEMLNRLPCCKCKCECECECDCVEDASEEAPAEEAAIAEAVAEEAPVAEEADFEG